MEFDLQPLTEPSKRMVQLAEKHAEDSATRVSQHDHYDTFAVENVEALKKSGFAAGAMPEEFGGLGLTSIHDGIVAISRLGRGDPSTALAFNMHLFRTLRLAELAGSRNKPTQLPGRLTIQIGSSDRRLLLIGLALIVRQPPAAEDFHTSPLCSAERTPIAP